MKLVKKSTSNVIDEVDKTILTELINNAKAPIKELAKKSKVSMVTVINRIKRLEKEGIIEGYSAHINYAKLDFDVHTLIEVRISKGKMIELEKKIAEYPEVYELYDTTGDFEVTLLARFKNTRTLDTFVKNLQQLDFVERTNTKLILNTIKDTQAVIM